MAAVLPPLSRLLAGLRKARAGGRFILWFLSDTQDPALAAAEAAAIAGFDGGGIAVRYRRRAENTGFKAGNVMDFLDHHAGDAELMLCLDADSEMTAPAVLRLVACMEADPRLAILQQLIVGRPATAAFPRLFQFGMRAGMRAWATGQAWWQGPEGPYWGHNAVIRIAPFRRHCRLEALPDGSPILSHDQVEAVRPHAAGWKVCCLPIEEGQHGGQPARPAGIHGARPALGRGQHAVPRPAVPAGADLDGPLAAGAGDPAVPRRAALVRRAGLRGAERRDRRRRGDAGWLAAGAAARQLGDAARAEAGRLCRGAAEAPAGRALWRARGLPARRGGGAGLHHAARPHQHLQQGALPAGAALRRAGAGWAAQNRADRGVGWADAARLLWPHTLFGATAFALLAMAGAAWWALPFAGGLLLAIPLLRGHGRAGRLSGAARRPPGGDARGARCPAGLNALARS
ncbi:glycosyltransferase [Dankookia sp. P2]|uniref:glycosyltransferase n=1 Tax=Dankookia sp. P2 TaxID=3423955 RepID=UPI003D67667C